MTFVAAVATGAESVATLESAVRDRCNRREISWAAHQGIAVAWNARHRWVSSSDDGDVLVVLDGQLHNLFHATRTPAAILADRYREVGADLGRGLLGDFVVIVLDRRNNRLVVCRDPLGVRPWYQATSGPRHAGATDMATLVGLPWVDDSVDDRQAVAFLAAYTVSVGPTLYRDVSTLLPGWTWQSANGSVERWQHHVLDIRPEVDVSWSEAVQRCRDLMDEVVSSRIRAAGAATSELSGGLDSSAVTGTAVLLGADDILTGRLLFEGPEADERGYSDAVLEHWGLPCLSTPPWIPDPGEALAWTLDLRRPIPDPNFAMSASLLRAFVREGRATTMTGLGGDDAFIEGSRKRRIISAIQHRQLDVLAAALRQDVRHPRSAWRGTWRGVLGLYLPRRHRPAAPTPVSAAAAQEYGLIDLLVEPVQRLTGDPAVDERADGLTSGYITAVLEEAALVDDTTGCRSSHPFLDPRFIEGTYGLNPWFPVRGGHDRALEVAAYGDRLPWSVRQRRSKAEFSEVYDRAGLADQTTVGAILNGPLQARRWLNGDSVAAVVHEARSGVPGGVQKLARARSLDLWLRSRGT